MKNKALLSLYALISVIALSVAGIYLISTVDKKSEKKDIGNNQEVLSESTENSRKAIKIQVQTNSEDELKDSTEYTVENFTQGKSAFDLLNDLQAQNPGFKYEYKQYDFGVMINSINGIIPDGNHFWKFQINGKDASVGISDYKVQEGDTLNFVLDEIQL